jgi:hypothetical protein
MKVKRKDWEALQAKVESLVALVQETRSENLMPIKTGGVLTSVIVPAILDHLNVEARHGYSQLFPKAP